MCTMLTCDLYRSQNSLCGPYKQLTLRLHPLAAAANAFVGGKECDGILTQFVH